MQTLTNKTLDFDNNTISNIEVDNFKASAIVIESEGIGSNDNDTTLPTSAAVKNYVDSQVDTADTLSEILAIGNTTGATKISVNNTSSGIDFIDNAKARFGTGNDLEIYHDGTDSFIKNNTGLLRIEQNVTDGDIQIKADDGGGSETTYIFCDGSTGKVELSNLGVKKFETTPQGIQITGEVELGEGTANKIQFIGGQGNWRINISDSANQFVIHSESLAADYFTVIGGGGIKLNAYGSGNKTGTVAKNLAVDSSGNIIETDGGVVDGSGTANDVVMWSDSNTLTDAPIAISGTKSIFAGNVGIGVTPESWGTSGDTKALRISTMSSLSEAFDGTILASNFYFNGSNDKYIQSDFATQYLQIDGTHLFKVAASGTANNNISFTTALTIANNSNATFKGNIVIDNASPILQANSSNAASGLRINVTGLDGDGDDLLRVQDTGTNRFKIRRDGLVTTTNSLLIPVGKKLILGDSSHTYISEDIDDRLRFFVGGDEFMRFTEDSSDTIQLFQDTTVTGELNVKDATHTIANIKSGNNDNILFLQAIQSDNARVGTSTNTHLSFFTNSSERVRVDNSGNVGITQTSPVGKIHTFSTSTNGATDYAGNNFGIVVSQDNGNNAGDEGNGIVFTQQYAADGVDAGQIRTGAIIGHKVSATGTFGGGLKFKVQPAGANALATALTLSNNSSATFAGNVTVNGNLQFTGSDPTAIYRNSGGIQIKAESVRIKGVTTNENIAAFIENGAVELYHDNTKKFETTSSGVSVTGSATFTKSIEVQGDASQSSEGGHIVLRANSGGAKEFGIDVDSSNNLRIITEDDGTNNNGVAHFTMSNTGAATFAGSLTVNGDCQLDGNLIGNGIRSANRGELHLNATGTDDVAEVFFGFASGYTESKIRWAISDRGTTEGRLQIYQGPANGGFTPLMTFQASNDSIGINETNPLSNLVVRSDNAGGRGGELSILNLATNTVGNEAALNFGLENSTYAGDASNAQIKARVNALNSATDMIFSTWNGSAFDERMRISGEGNVGVGSSSPKTSLDVVKDADIWHFMAGGATKKLLVGGQAANGDVVLQAGAASSVNNQVVSSAFDLTLQRDGGNVRIGDAGTSNLYLGNIISASSADRGMRLHTNNADFFFDFQGDGVNQLFFRDYDGSGGIHTRHEFRIDNGSITISGSLTQNGSPSDKKYKENIKTISNGIDKIEKLNPVEFDWNDKSDAHKIGKKEDAGFIAQEVQKVLPNLVNENVDGDLALNYEGIIPYLVQSIQELKKEIEILKNK